MLQHPVTAGSENELRWMIAETDALRRFRSEMSHEWRINCGGNSTLDHAGPAQPRTPATTVESSEGRQPNCVPADFQPLVQDIIDRFGRSSIESSSDGTWEQVCLGLLWNLSLCRMKSTPAQARAVHREVRHRDLLLDDAEQRL